MSDLTPMQRLAALERTRGRLERNIKTVHEFAHGEAKEREMKDLEEELTSNAIAMDQAMKERGT